MRISFTYRNSIQCYYIPVADSNVVNQDPHVQILDGSVDFVLGLLIKVGVVAHHIVNFDSFVSLGINLLLDVLQLGFCSTNQQDVEALFGQRQGIRFANPVSGTWSNSKQWQTKISTK